MAYHLFFPYPYSRVTNACGKFENKFDDDQKVYSFPQADGTTVYIGFPCKAYPEAYIITYVPLARTWIRDKPDIVN